jgi:hypothetical protein
MKENKKLKEEAERLKRDLIQLKGKCNSQPSQDNREYMVKKLEKGSTEACIKPHQEGHKSNSGKVKGNLKKYNMSKMKQFNSRLQKFQDAAVPHPGVVVPHLGRTAKPPRSPRCNFNQRRL